MINHPPLEKAELHTNPSLQSAAPGRQETAVTGALPGWLLRQAGCPQGDRRAPASRTSLPEEGGEGDSSPGSLPLRPRRGQRCALLGVDCSPILIGYAALPLGVAWRSRSI